MNINENSLSKYGQLFKAVTWSDLVSLTKESEPYLGILAKPKSLSQKVFNWLWGL